MGIDTPDHGCISRDEFNRRRNAIAADHRADSEFTRLWALGTLNVDEAHAALAVKYGANTKPGDGVTVGVMDSGVDLTHHELNGSLSRKRFSRTYRMKAERISARVSSPTARR